MLDRPESMVQAMLQEYDIATETVDEARQQGESFIDQVKLALLSDASREITAARMWPDVFGQFSSSHTGGDEEVVSVDEGIAAENSGQSVVWDLDMSDEDTQRMLQSMLGEAATGDAVDLPVESDDDDGGWM